MAGADSRRSRTKAQLPQLESKTPWRHMAEYQHKGVRVTCSRVQEGRYWACKGYLHGSPDDAMDRIERRGPYSR